jgi:DNA polymerase I-like protein with 3'-5' exonuclease and polymerase domains
MDLTTAEVYVAAVLSDDLELQDIFRSGGNFHSSIAKRVFRLDCEVEEVETLHKTLRQAAKAVTFGIMYGAGAKKISEQVNKDGGNMSVRQAQEVIDEYFNTFWKLKEWIEATKGKIQRNRFIYSPFGRKRRLPNVASDNQGVKGHEIRSGLNFVVQSTASDINLLGAIDMQQYIKAKGMKASIFALVHDSILAEVPEDELDIYIEKLVSFVQQDRGCCIPGAPVGCDIEIDDDYSMGKFVKKYADKLQEIGIS